MNVSKKAFLLLLSLVLSLKSMGAQANIRVLGEEKFQEIEETAHFLANYFELDADVYIIIAVTPCLPHLVDGYTLFEDHHGIKQLFVKISSKLSLKNQLAVLAHEMVHVKQFVNGDLIKKQDECYHWKGHQWKNINHLDYLDRPWEQEAIRMQHALVRLYKKTKTVRKRENMILQTKLQ